MIKFRTIYNKWIEVTPERALELAAKLYAKVKCNPDFLNDINKRFREICFSSAELRKKVESTKS